MENPPSSETGTTVLDRSALSAERMAAEQRQRIIEAMVASCAEQTYSGTTISDIVTRAGVSKTTFYKRFRDKRECFDAALESSMEALREVGCAATDGVDSPAEAIRLGTAAMLELMAARPQLAQLLATEAVAVDPAVSGRYRRLLIPALEGMWGEAESGAPRTDPRLAFGRAQVLVISEVAAGRAERLPALAPEISYLALAPFLGHEEALCQARLGARNSDAEPGPRADR